MDAAINIGCSRLLSEQTGFPEKHIQDVKPKLASRKKTA